jgi:hypothetical protein
MRMNEICDMVQMSCGSPKREEGGRGRIGSISPPPRGAIDVNG